MNTHPKNLPNVAITIKQPWASLIVSSSKDIENRNWPTKYRGPVLIHASKKLDPLEMLSYGFLREDRNISIKWNDGPAPKFKDLPCGGIIGVAEIIDCVQNSNSPWFIGKHGFVLANARPLPFYACNGSLGFWRCQYPAELLNT